MRLVDKRTQLSRRDFLATGSAAALTLGAASIASQSEAWAMDVTALKPPTMRTLIVIARDIYPHDRLTDQAYAEALMPYDAAAATDEKLKNLLENGVADLDIRAVAAHAAAYHLVGSEAQRLALLKTTESSPFFQKLRGDLIARLYNNKRIWKKFGYEGPSADAGGYIERGFDDIDWV